MIGDGSPSKIDAAIIDQIASFPIADLRRSATAARLQQVARALRQRAIRVQSELATFGVTSCNAFGEQRQGTRGSLRKRLHFVNACFTCVSSSRAFCDRGVND